MPTLVLDTHTLGAQACVASAVVQRETLFRLGQKWTREETLSPTEVAIASFALRLTIRPDMNGRQDVDALIALGLSAIDVHDVVQVSACFAYMNRLADGLGAALEPHKEALARALFGPEALAAHRARTDDPADRDVSRPADFK